MTLDPQAQKLFQAMVKQASKHEVVDVIKASLNMLAVSIGQYAVSQNWNEDQTIKWATEQGHEVASMVKQNWGKFPAPR